MKEIDNNIEGKNNTNVENNNNLADKKTEEEKKDYEKDIKSTARAREISYERMKNRARANIDFHLYDTGMYVGKQVLLDIANQYKMFFSVDKTSKDFIDKVIKYASLDPAKSDVYDEERTFVRDFEKLVTKMNKYLDKLENEFKKDIDAVDWKAYEKLSDNDKKLLDYKFTSREEAINNRKRAVASFDMYFNTLKNGDMTAFDEIMKTVEDANATDEHKIAKKKIDEANKKTNKDVSLQFFKINGKRVYYINSAGAKYNRHFRDDGEEYGKIVSVVGNMGTKTGYEKDMRKEPLFVHDPCMSDISQGYVGDCYMMAALQNVARLYPQMIRNMIKDNGDGTATVRLYARKREDGETRYFPVYVRVDKTIPKMGLGAFNRLANDCLWANMIEKAYMMSGLHLTFDDNTNLPKEYKNYKRNVNNVETTPYDMPAIDAIEGGDEGLFTETLLGPLGQCETLTILDPEDLDNELVKYTKEIKTRDMLKNAVDEVGYEAFAKHAMKKMFVYDNKPVVNGETLSNENYYKLSKEDIVGEFASRLGTAVSKSNMWKDTNPNDLKDRCFETYDCILKLADYLKSQYDGNLPTSLKEDNLKRLFQKIYIIEQYSKKLDISVKYNKNIDAIFRDIHIDLLTGMDKEASDQFKQEVDQKCKQAEYIFSPCSEYTKEWEVYNKKYDELPKREIFFDKIQLAIKQGYIVGAGTKSTFKEVKVCAPRHAYSVIGAYKTNDTPPKYFIRLNNPTKNSVLGYNATEYNESEDYLPKGHKAYTEDGISDISLEDFCHDFDRLKINGRRVLNGIPCQKTEGYDVITAEDKEVYKKDNMTIDKLSDYMKVTDDLYEALLATNSVFSNDSEQYKDLLEGIKLFRYGIATSNGKDMDGIKRLAGSLDILVQHYEVHLGEDSSKYSKRQQARFAVCKEIYKVVDYIEKDINPYEEYAKDYANRLYEQLNKNNKIAKEEIDNEVATRLYNNKAFRNLASNTSIFAMANADTKQMNEHLNHIEKTLTGKGIVKGVDMKTMKPKSEFMISV